MHVGRFGGVLVDDMERARVNDRCRVYQSAERGAAVVNRAVELVNQICVVFHRLEISFFLFTVLF